MTSRPALSILDPSPVFEGRGAAAALAETRALAEAADGMGYRAFWVQEHHNAASFAGTAPEIQIADLAARTRRIRIGAAGVMLPNYSPLKVAEQFAMLSALHPGRIELGLGRATGADPRSSAALLGPGAEAFPRMLALLTDWLLDASGEVRLAPNHPAQGIRAQPAGARPDVWMLASSPDSAAYAGAAGMKLAFADFLAPGGAEAALDVYRAAFRPGPLNEAPHAAVALTALAAETQAEADRLASTGLAWSIGRMSGRFAPFSEVRVAEAQLRSAPESVVSDMRANQRAGTPDAVAAALREVATRCGADELVLLTVCDRLDARIRSYALIEAAWAALSW